MVCVKDTDRILRRIKGLLATAEGEANINESHTAFLKAQEMMVKYGVDPSDVTDNEEVKEVFDRTGTDYKRLYWYERNLARIIAKNFRCKNYIRWTKLEGDRQKKNRIEFMGLEEDVLLASEMYRLVVDAINFYAQKHIKKYGKGIRRHTQSLKDDYMMGFIAGLERKFEEQIEGQEWGLVLVVPKEVEDKFKREITGKAATYNIPRVEEQESYQEGYRDGNGIDYKKETIDDTIQV